MSQKCCALALSNSTTVAAAAAGGSELNLKQICKFLAVLVFWQTVRRNGTERDSLLLLYIHTRIGSFRTETTNLSLTRDRIAECRKHCRQWAAIFSLRRILLLLSLRFLCLFAVVVLEGIGGKLPQSFNAGTRCGSAVPLSLYYSLDCSGCGIQS